MRYLNSKEVKTEKPTSRGGGDSSLETSKPKGPLADSLFSYIKKWYGKCDETCLHNITSREVSQ